MCMGLGQTGRLVLWTSGVSARPFETRTPPCDLLPGLATVSRSCNHADLQPLCHCLPRVSPKPPSPKSLPICLEFVRVSNLHPYHSAAHAHDSGSRMMLTRCPPSAGRHGPGEEGLQRPLPQEGQERGAQAGSRQADCYHGSAVQRCWSCCGARKDGDGASCSRSSYSSGARKERCGAEAD